MKIQILLKQKMMMEWIDKKEALYSASFAILDILFNNRSYCSSPENLNSSIELY